MWPWQAFIIRVIIGFSTFGKPPKDRGPVGQKKMRKKEKEPREKSPQLPNAAVAFASIE